MSGSEVTSTTPRVSWVIVQLVVRHAAVWLLKGAHTPHI